MATSPQVAFVLVLGLLLVARPAAAADGELGPPQVCRCYPPGAYECKSPGPSPTASTSTSPVSPLPTPTPLPRCDFDSPDKLDVRIDFVADDGADIMICQRSVYTSNTFDEHQNFNYVGACGDLVVRVTNYPGTWSGLSVKMKFADGSVYGTTSTDNPNSIPGVKPLYATVAENPSDACMEDPSSCSWQPAVLVWDILSATTEWFSKLANDGAYPIGFANGNVGGSTYGYYFRNPMCS